MLIRGFLANQNIKGYLTVALSLLVLLLLCGGLLIAIGLGKVDHLKSLHQTNFRGGVPMGIVNGFVNSENNVLGAGDIASASILHTKTSKALGVVRIYPELVIQTDNDQKDTSIDKNIARVVAIVTDLKPTTSYHMWIMREVCLYYNASKTLLVVIYTIN